MAYIELNKNRLEHNYHFLNSLFSNNNIEWGVVGKMLCGNKKFLELLIDLGIKEIHDSRISNIKVVKRINPEIQTVYIKPPAKKAINSVVKYADVSFNTEYETIKLISDEAKRQDKLHKIIIMIEMGDLREGVLGENLIEFYAGIFELPNIEVIGLGANLNCLSGVMPTHDKLIQLSLYKQLIETTFKRKIPWITGGSSITIPLLPKKLVPKGINHFRIGETLYRGVNLFTDKQLKGMKTDVFKLYGQIIELTEKPVVPIGEMGSNVDDIEVEVKESDYGKTAYRAILDIGILDINLKDLTPIRKGIEISGGSSDMIVVDIGENKSKYKMGDFIGFKVSYMGILSVMNSNYIDKVIV